jgi:hypothetical protein
VPIARKPPLHGPPGQAQWCRRWGLPPPCSTHQMKQLCHWNQTKHRWGSWYFGGHKLGGPSWPLQTAPIHPQTTPNAPTHPTSLTQNVSYSNTSQPCTHTSVWVAPSLQAHKCIRVFRSLQITFSHCAPNFEEWACPALGHDSRSNPGVTCSGTQGSSTCNWVSNRSRNLPMPHMHNALIARVVGGAHRI